MIKPVCPHCKIPLSRRSHKGILQYTCPSCFGFSVPMGALKKIMSPKEATDLWTSAQHGNDGAPCSHCLGPMKVVYASPSSVELDVCRRCLIVWLDTGEWHDIEKLGTPLKSETANLAYGRLLLQLENEKANSVSTFRIEEVSIAEIGGLKTTLSILGLPVEEKEDTFLESPWVTWGLIAICSVISLWGFANLRTVLDYFSYNSDRSLMMKPLTMLTSFFFHASWWHLIGNMYFLWIFGDNVEDHLGKLKYLFLLLTSILFAAVFYGKFHATAAPVIGASGGIAGITAYYIFRFPFRRFVINFFYVKRFAIPALLFGGLFFLKEFLGFLAETQVEGYRIAHSAHLGGALAGVLFAFFGTSKRKLDR